MVPPRRAKKSVNRLQNARPVSWRTRAQRVMGSDSAPTWSLDLRVVQDQVEERRARAVIDLAMRVAESTLSTGASAADVTATVLRLTDAYGLRSVHVDVTFTSISVSHHRVDAPLTLMRTVRVRSADYDRLARLQAFVTDLENNPVDVADAQARFEAIAARPHLYRRTFVTLAAGLLGAAVCVLLGGSWAEVVIALGNAVVVDRVQLWLSRRRIAAFFSQMIGGAVPTVIALLLILARAQQVPGLEHVSPASVVAAGIVTMLAGLSVVGAAQDAIDGYYLTSVARTFEVVVLTLGVLVGVLVVLQMGQRFGTPSYLAPYVNLTGNLGVQLFASAVIAGAFALVSYAGPVTTLVCVLCGTAGWGGFALGLALGLGPTASSGGAALVVGALSQFLAGTWRVPALALSTAGIVPLLPGLMVYRGLYQVTVLSSVQGSSPGIGTLGEAAATGLALAAGVSLGTYFGRPLRPDVSRSPSRAQQRALRRASADGRE